MVADPDPLGLGDFVPGMMVPDLGIAGTFKGDFRYGLGIQAIYDSNFFQTETDEESEITALFNPWLNYTSDPEGGAMFSLTANYRPSFRSYLENSELNGVDQAGDVALSFQKSRTRVDVFGRYAEVSGTDFLAGGFIEGSVLTTGFRVRREIAPRTSLVANWSLASSSYDSSENAGAKVYTTGLGAFWQATERLSFGPKLRYTTTESDNISSREAWALMVSARYRVGERIQLSASVGPEYSSYSGKGGKDGGGFGLAGSLSARYMIDERWTWTNSIRTAAVPSPNQNNLVINNVAVETALHRLLLRGTVSGGLRCHFSNYEDVGTGATDRDNGQNVGAYLRYGRTLFTERLGFNSEISYTVNNGEDDEWSQLRLSLGLTLAF